MGNLCTHSRDSTVPVPHSRDNTENRVSAEAWCAKPRPDSEREDPIGELLRKIESDSSAKRKKFVAGPRGKISSSVQNAGCKCVGDICICNYIDRLKQAEQEKLASRPKNQ